MSTQRFVVHAAAIALALAAGAAFGQAQKAAEPAAAPPPANGPIVKVRQGEAQGIVADGVAVFKGLPFAAPPVGDLRWRDPQLPAKWSGVRAANASDAADEYVMEFPASSVPVVAKHFHKDRLDWVEAGLGH
jgi:hypothetical protein